MKRIVLILIFVLLCFKGYSIEDKHLIVSIDLKSEITMYDREYAVSKIKSVIPRMLSNNNITDGYASIQFFSVNENASNLDEYVKNINTPFTPFSDVNNVVDGLLESDFYRYHGNHYSVVTIAKPYSLLKFRDIASDKLIEKTYLILVTDYKYNGNDDFYGELKHVPRISKDTKESIMNTIKDVQQNYFYKFIAEENISRYPRSGYISLFEVIPLQQYFSVESVLDFPHKITATRTKDGYKAVFKINQLDNPNYSFISSEAFIPVEGHNEIRPIKLNQKVIFDIPKSLIEQLGEDNISITFRTWVQLIDNVYNHTILSPDGDKLQGAEGLNRSIKIEFEKDAEILGIIPLTDGLYNISFWTNNQNIAAATWGVIFILILLGIMIFIIWKSTQYRSKNNDVKI